MRRVEHHGVDILGHQCRHAIHGIGRDADAGRHAQTSLRVLAGIGVVLQLGNVPICNKTDQMTLVVDYGQLLDLILQQHFGCVFEFGVVRCHDPLARHDLLDRPLAVGLESQVAVRHYAYQLVVGVDDGYASYLVLVHQRQRIAHRMVFRYRNRVVDHAALGALDTSYVRSLLGYRHVLVDHAYAALARQRYRQRSLGHGIHGRRYYRDVESDISREPACGIHFSRQHV